MSDLFWLTDEQVARLEPFFPKSHGKPRVDDRRVLSGIVFISRSGLHWRDALRPMGRTRRSTAAGSGGARTASFARMMTGLAGRYRERKTVMIDATYLKAHHTGTSMAAKKGVWRGTEAPGPRKPPEWVA